MDTGLVDKVALVTGASSGIGRATALALAREGVKVVVSDVADDLGAALAAQVVDRGGSATFVRCDVARSSDCARAVEVAVERYGALHLAFNNAGIEGPLAATAAYPEEEFRRVVDVNLLGVWYCMKHELPAMLAAGGGSIVNCASILGRVGFANAPAYTAAKHGVLGLTKTAALEYGGRGVRVNAVCPAFIVTPMLERAGMMKDRETRARVEGLHALGRMGTPDEVADAVVYLFSQRASFVTGEAFMVDGGYIAQ